VGRESDSDRVTIDASLDEALRQRYADVLNDPVPQRLLQALQGQPRQSADHEEGALEARVARFVRPAGS
jgi:hypothetical protein